MSAFNLPIWRGELGREEEEEERWGEGRQGELNTFVLCSNVRECTSHEIVFIIRLKVVRTAFWTITVVGMRTTTKIYIYRYSYFSNRISQLFSFSTFTPVKLLCVCVCVCVRGDASGPACGKQSRKVSGIASRRGAFAS